MCPIFQVSNVSGENLNLLKMFLNLLTARITSHDDEPAEFQIDDTYSVPVYILLHEQSFSPSRPPIPVCVCDMNI